MKDRSCCFTGHRANSLPFGYAKYDPFADTLRIECEISRDNGSSYFDYEPTSAESQLIKNMIAEKLMQTHG